ncbi:MAG: hypothetical protein GC150_09360 [Rhizobiales bacterium]|nr:hypothetical protein [Hyphomicrobiales bacterium]
MLFAAIVVLWLLWPRASPAWLALLGLGGLHALWSRGLMAQAWRSFGGPLGLAALAFVLYALASALWAAEPDVAVGKALLLGLFALLAGLAAQAFMAHSEMRISALQRALAVTAGFGVAFYAVEIAGDTLIWRSLMNFIPALRPGSPKDLVLDGEEVTHVRAFWFNFHIASLVPLVWPAAAAFVVWRGLGAWRFLAAGAILVGAALTAGFSEHGSSAVALSVGLAVLLVGFASARLALVLVVAGWLAATLLVVPAAQTAYRLGLHQAEWVPWTGRARIILWDTTAERWHERPFFGVGARSTKALDIADGKDGYERPEGFIYPRRTGRHAHNVFMQTWYELGAVGGILLALVGLAGLRAIWRMPRPARPWALALFASMAVVGAFSWGMWQAWFLAYFGLGVAFCGLLARFFGAPAGAVEVKRASGV